MQKQMRHRWLWLIGIFVLLNSHVQQVLAFPEVRPDSGASALSKAASPADTLQISVLICSPGKKVYELYGHAALRVKFKEGNSQRDYVFNYGIFDYATPHFIWRFMMGETDYTVAVCPYDAFMDSYSSQGRVVQEEILNLCPKEALRLFSLLLDNANTPGWSYRYNFLYDNCTTRLLDMIEASVEGKVVWPKAEDGKRTFRDIVHEFAAPVSPWNAFGQDLILGAEMDVPLSARQQSFAPAYAACCIAQARIISADGSQRPLLKGVTGGPVPQVVPSDASSFLSPAGGMWMLLALTLAVMLWERHRKKVCRWLDNLLLLLQGGIGCVVALLFFFSQHPAVGSNWLVLLFNPLPLFALPYKIWREHQGRQPIYREAVAVEVVVLTLAFLMAPQCIPLEVYVLLAVLALRSAVPGILAWMALRKHSLVLKGHLNPISESHVIEKKA